MASFILNTDQLRESAARIEENCNQFVQTYQGIYNATNELNVSYQGQASDMFNQKIRAYENDFLAVENTLKKYIEFIRVYANEVDEMHRKHYDEASRLSSGE